MNRLQTIKHRILLTAFAALLLLVQACGSSRRSEPIRGPLALESAKLEQGKVVFMEHCHKCHPGGETGLGPALNNKPAPGFLIRIQVRNGLGAMPGFNRELISNEEMDGLVAYVKALRRN
jgi:mono/diheme cytochrome c family protein